MKTNPTSSETCKLWYCVYLQVCTYLLAKTDKIRENVLESAVFLTIVELDKFRSKHLWRTWETTRRFSFETWEMRFWICPVRPKYIILKSSNAALERSTLFLVMLSAEQERWTKSKFTLFDFLEDFFPFVVEIDHHLVEIDIVCRLRGLIKSF